MPPRLDAVLELLLPCEVLADVGTDHGLVPVAAVERGLCARAIATDVRDAPLLAARATIEDAELPEVIALRRGDGLRALRGERVDAIVLAGMSGALMVELFTRDDGKLREAAQLVVQPNKDAEMVRAWARSSGWHVRDERLSVEKGRFYPVIAFTRGAGADPAYEGLDEDAALMLGPHLLRRRDDTLRAYCVMQEARLAGFVDGEGHVLAGQLAMFRRVLSGGLA